VPHRVILNLLLDIYLSRSLATQGPKKTFTEKCSAHRGSLEVLLEIEERLPLSCRTSMAAPLRGSVGGGGPGAPTINVVKRRWWAPGRCWSWRSRSAHHQCWKTLMASPLGGGAGAGGLGAPTINTGRRRRQAPWAVPELEIWEHPPSMLENINSRPPWEAMPELEVWERPP
jgi:hypothetical protein